jgi:hypothetical protein
MAAQAWSNTNALAALHDSEMILSLTENTAIRVSELGYGIVKPKDQDERAST